MKKQNTLVIILLTALFLTAIPLTKAETTLAPPTFDLPSTPNWKVSPPVTYPNTPGFLDPTGSGVVGCGRYLNEYGSVDSMVQINYEKAPTGLISGSGLLKSYAEQILNKWFSGTSYHVVLDKSGIDRYAGTVAGWARATEPLSQLGRVYLVVAFVSGDYFISAQAYWIDDDTSKSDVLYIINSIKVSSSSNPTPIVPTAPSEVPAGTTISAMFPGDRDTTVTTADNKVSNPSQGYQLHIGDVLKTGKVGVILNVGGQEVYVNKYTKVVITDPDPVDAVFGIPTGNAFISGTSTSSGTSQTGKHPVIQTPHATVTPDGTEFEVAVSDTATTVRTFSGTVSVYDVNRQGIVSVGAGQTTTVMQGGLPSIPIAFDPNSVDAWWSNVSPQPSTSTELPSEYPTSTPLETTSSSFFLNSITAIVIVVIAIAVIVPTVVVLALRKNRNNSNLRRPLTLVSYCPTCRQPLALSRDNYGPYEYCPTCNYAYRLRES